MRDTMFGLFNLAGGHIILILAILLIVLVMPTVFLGIIFPIIRAGRIADNPPPLTAPPAFRSSKL